MGAAVRPLLSISYAASADDIKQRVDGFNQRFIHDFFSCSQQKQPQQLSNTRLSLSG